MSSDANPVLAGSIPAFELFMTSWERLPEKHPRLKSWIDIGLGWAHEYYSRMDLTDAYIISMGKWPIVCSLSSPTCETSSQSLHLLWLCYRPNRDFHVSYQSLHLHDLDSSELGRELYCKGRTNRQGNCKRWTSNFSPNVYLY